MLLYCYYLFWFCNIFIKSPYQKISGSEILSFYEEPEGIGILQKL